MDARAALLTRTVTRRSALVGAAAAAMAAPALRFGWTPAAAQDQITLTLVAYSTPREAYEEIIPLFQATPEGANVQFETSFAGSTEQSRSVESGLPADILALSLEPDITRLIEPGLVAEDWNDDEFRGMVSNSVVVFAVREGNPKGIQTWDDLLKEGVEVITPNALTSGGARWNIMAAWGAQLEQGKTEEEAQEYLRELFKHVPVQDKSAREALATFTGGKGDVLLAYENESITAQQKGEQLEYVIPAETLLIENPVAIVTESAYPEKAQEFINFLRTPEAQRIYSQKGYRSVLPEIQEEFAETYPQPEKLFTIDQLGGWADVTTKFFDPDNGIVAVVQR